MIRSAFIKTALKYHPDKCKMPQEKCKELIRVAYSAETTLKNDLKKNIGEGEKNIGDGQHKLQIALAHLSPQHPHNNITLDMLNVECCFWFNNMQEEQNNPEQRHIQDFDAAIKNLRKHKFLGFHSNNGNKQIIIHTISSDEDKKIIKNIAEQSIGECEKKLIEIKKMIESDDNKNKEKLENFCEELNHLINNFKNNDKDTTVIKSSQPTDLKAQLPTKEHTSSTMQAQLV